MPRLRLRQRMESLDFHFLLLGLAFLAVVVVVSACATLPFWQGYDEARRSLRHAGEFRDVLAAGYRLSIEREAATAWMFAAPEAAPATHERLLEIQKRTDAALHKIEKQRADERDPIQAGLVEAARRSLGLARADVARVAALSPQDRTVHDIRGAISGTLVSFDRFADVLGGELQRLGEDRSITAIGTVGILSLQLRDSAGRLGSLIQPSLAVNQPLGPDDMKRIERMRGRVLALWSFIRTQPDLGTGRPLEETAAEAAELFFGGGLAFINSLIAQGNGGSLQNFSAEDVARYYVPTLEPLEKLGRSFASLLIQRLEKTRDDALHGLVIAGIGSALLFCLLLALLAYVELRMIGPLRLARQAIVGLAAGSEVPPFPEANRIGEMRRLFGAVTVLQERMRERDMAMAELKRQAETDGLTGIANRRLLETLALAPEGDGQIASLVIADIDHFKAINDTYGHLFGDDALRLVAMLFAEAAPEDSLLARFGGEEFALLLPGRDRFAAAGIAEALRRSLASRTVPAPTGGAPIQIRASFGVATGRLGPADWPRLTDAADQALYRAKTEGRDCVRMAA